MKITVAFPPPDGTDKGIFLGCKQGSFLFIERRFFPASALFFLLRLAPQIDSFFLSLLGAVIFVVFFPEMGEIDAPRLGLETECHLLFLIEFPSSPWRQNLREEGGNAFPGSITIE